MSKLIKGAGILAAGALIAKLIGVFYRIPLTNIVGAEGIGLYQMVFPLYTVLLSISSGGLPSAISKVVSMYTAKNDEVSARKVLSVCLVSLIAAGCVASAAVILLSKKIASVQGNDMAALPYLGIAPSILIVAVISCFRGYFQGKQNMLPSSVSQMVEQVVKLAAGLLLARALMPRGLSYAVFGATLGVTLSEVAAFLLLFVQFLFSTYKYKKLTRITLGADMETAGEIALTPPPRLSVRDVLKQVYSIAIPVTLGSLVMPVTAVIDSILVINMLVAGGAARGDATALFGLVNGPINSLINMPTVITLSIAVAMLPRISEGLSRGENLTSIVSLGVKFSFILGLMATLVLGVFSKNILSVLYSRGLTADQIAVGTPLLAMGSLSVIYLSILQVATSVLQGADRAHKPALNLLAGALVKVLLTVILLPRLGIMGAMAANVACYGITCVLDVISLKKACALKFNVYEMTVSPLISSVCFVGVGLLSDFLLGKFLPASVALISAMILAGIAFLAAIVLTRGIKKNELLRLPLVGKALKTVKAFKEKRAAAKKEKKAADAEK